MQRCGCYNSHLLTLVSDHQEEGDSVPQSEEELAKLKAIEAENAEDSRVADAGVHTLKTHLARLQVSAAAMLSKAWSLQSDLD